VPFDQSACIAAAGHGRLRRHELLHLPHPQYHLLPGRIWWIQNGDTPEEQAHAERFGIFVGLWAPTLLILSNRFDRYADKAKDLPGMSLPDEDENK
jgi:hypothetical protein